MPLIPGRGFRVRPWSKTRRGQCGVYRTGFRRNAAHPL